MSANQEPSTRQSTSRLIYGISNSTRRSMIELLAKRQPLSFTELVSLCGLSPKYDTTGTFVYHLTKLTRIGIVRKRDNCYELTPLGKRANRVVRLLERESRFLDERREKEGVLMIDRDVAVRQASSEDNHVVAELVASEYYEQASQRYELPREYFERRKNETDFTLVSCIYQIYTIGGSSARSMHGTTRTAHLQKSPHLWLGT